MADEVKLPQIAITTKGNVAVSDSYVKGQFSLTDTDGSVVTLDIKVKTRGATAKAYKMKPAMNIKFRDADGESLDTCLLGMRSCSKWILDAMAIDRICMRNRVAMDIWNDYSSLPYKTDFSVTSQSGKTIYRSGTIGKYVEVSINGQYKGIYVLSDNINRKLLDLKKPKPRLTTENDTIRGVLYKSGTTDIANQNDPAFTDDYKTCVVAYHNAWELKEPEDYECAEAWAPLLDAIGSSLAPGTYERVNNFEMVKKYFSLENLADYQLHIMALRINDNWGNKNHFLSIRDIQSDINSENEKDALKRKFIISPWDLDTSLGGHYNGNYYDGYYGEDWLPEHAVKNGGCFPFSMCQGNAEYKELLKNRWKELRKTSYLPANVNKRLETYCDLLVNSGAWERNGAIHPCYVEDLRKEIGYVEEWYARRFQIMDEYFGTTNEPLYTTGDVNGDGSVDISDINAIITVICGAAD